MVKTIITTLIFFIFLSLFSFYMATRPFKIHSNLTPEAYRIPYENVSFKTEDNVLIKGWFIPSQSTPSKTIIVLHGYPADKSNILPSFIFLHKHFNLLLFDFRYMGESGGHYSTIAIHEVNDLKAAIAFLKKKNINEVYVIGFSVGAAVALLAAKTMPEIKAIVGISSFSRLDWMAENYYPIPFLNVLLGKMFRIWGLVFLHTDINLINPAQTISSLQIPILLFYSLNDRVVTLKHLYLMQEMVKNKKNITIMIDNKAHGELADDFQKTVLNFFIKSTHLKPKVD